ncbi:MAG: Ig-like domain-containing protein [Pirellulales bacterium]
MVQPPAKTLRASALSASTLPPRCGITAHGLTKRTSSGLAFDVIVSGTLAYVADQRAGLVILDVSNPAVPVRLGGYDTSGLALDLAISGTVLFVADYGGGLEIIDVSDPAAPVRLGGYDTIGLATGVAISGTMVYVADNTAGLQIIDVRNPMTPIRAGGCNTLGYAEQVAVCGTLAYVADGIAGLVIIDPNSPPDLDPDSDTGIGDSDNITGDNTPTFDIVVSVGSYFRFYRDGIQISGDWETGTAYTTSVQADGTSAYTVASVDAAGNASPLSPALSVTVDTTIPSTPDLLADSDTGISSTDNLANLDNSTPAKALRFAVGNTIVGATVTLYADGTAIGSAMADGPTTTVTTNGSLDLVDGVRAITARQTMPGKTESTDSGALSVTVDTGVPSSPPAPDLQAASDTGVSSTDNITTDKTPTFDVSVPAGSYFRFYRDGVHISGDFETGVSYTTVVQAEGVYGYAIATVDTAGNVSALSLALSVTLSSPAPSAPDLVADSDTGVSASDNLTNLDNSQPDKVLRFNVGNTIVGATVTLYANGAAIGNAVAKIETTTIMTNGSVDLPDGVRAITARQTLPGAPESPDSGVLRVTIDTTPPASSSAPDLQPGSDTGISNTDNTTGDNTPTFTISGVGGSYYRFYRDGVQISGEYQTGASYTAGPQADGTYRFAVAVVDAAGNISALSPALLVTIDTFIPLSPILLAVSDSGVFSTDRVTNLDNSRPERTLRFSVGNTVAGATVTLYAEGIAIGSAVAEGATTTVTTNGNRDLSDGMHAITARQTLPGRPESTDSVAVYLTIDTSAPASPQALNLQNASDTGISNTDNITGDNTPTFDLAVPAGSYFRIYRDGVQISGSYETGAVYTAAVQADGTYAYTVAAVDGTGNVSASSPALRVTVDSAIPSALDLLAGSDTGISNTDKLTNLDNSQPDKTLQFAVGNTVAGATVTLYANGVAIGSAVAEGATTIVTTSGNRDLSDGMHAITARQTFPGRPESTDSAALTVTIDTAAPVYLNPVRLGGYDFNDFVRGLAVSGTLAYVAIDQGGLAIIDVSVPAVPMLLGQLDTRSAQDVVVSGTLAYVADENAGLVVIDVSNPAAPARVGSYDTSGLAYGVAVSGTLAYVADDTAGLQIIDVTNPSAPVLLGRYGPFQ